MVLPIDSHSYNFQKVLNHTFSMKMIFLNKAIEDQKKIIQPPWKSQITWVSLKKLSPPTILKKQFLFINYVKAE